MSFEDTDPVELLAQLDSIEQRLLDVMTPEEITEAGRLLVDLKANTAALAGCGKTGMAIDRAWLLLGKFDKLMRTAKGRAEAKEGA